MVMNTLSEVKIKIIVGRYRVMSSVSSDVKINYSTISDVSDGTIVTNMNIESIRFQTTSVESLMEYIDLAHTDRDYGRQLPSHLVL